jgi:hypothetical protein
MKQVFIPIIGAFIFTACNKDKFQSKPQIKIESQNYDFVPRNQDLQIIFSFTDKEGDVDDSLYLIRTRLNQRGPYSDIKPLDFKVPSFPDQQSGEMTVTLSYGFGLTAGISTISIPGSTQKEPDTMALKFVVVDKAKNISDTATANVIVERF